MGTRASLRRTCSAVLLTVFMALHAASLTAAEGAKPPAAPPGSDKPRVTKAYVTPGSNSARLGDDLTVEVDKLQELLDDAAAAEKNLILYLEGRPLKDAIPLATTTKVPKSKREAGTLVYPLCRTDDSNDAWQRVLGSPPGLKTRTVKVSVGLEGAPFALPSAATVSMIVIPGDMFWLWLVIVVATFIAFIYLAVMTDLLRDSGPQFSEGKRRPYSLARVQAAWWFFIILASYLFIAMITGDWAAPMSNTVLGLMGISAATAVGAALVDGAKTTPEKLQEQADAADTIQSRIATLEATIPAENASAEEKAAARAAMPEKAASVTKLKSQLKKLNKQNENFIIDILSDINGVSFHRFQIVAWTIVLGIIFIIAVYNQLAMPEFDPSLLALLAISAGTYVGLKIPEPTVPNVIPPAA